MSASIVIAFHHFFPKCHQILLKRKNYGTIAISLKSLNKLFSTIHFLKLGWLFKKFHSCGFLMHLCEKNETSSSSFSLGVFLHRNIILFFENSTNKIFSYFHILVWRFTQWTLNPSNEFSIHISDIYTCFYKFSTFSLFCQNFLKENIKKRKYDGFLHGSS